MEAKKKIVRREKQKTTSWGCYKNDAGQYQTFDDGEFLLGSIRCTYVDIYDKENNKIGSLNCDNVAELNQRFNEVGVICTTEKVRCKAKEKIGVTLNLADDNENCSTIKSKITIKQEYMGTWVNALSGNELVYIRPNACYWVAPETDTIEEATTTDKKKSSSLLKWLTLGLTAYGTFN